MKKYNNIQSSNGIIVCGNKVTIDGKELPKAPCDGRNSTIINGKVYLDGYEFRNNKWKRTLKAFWYLFF